MNGLIIHTVAINRMGEIRHFEIPLSNNAGSICGVWYKIRLLDDVTPIRRIIQIVGRSTYQPEFIVGQLSLASNQREGVFFYGNLLLEDTNQAVLDYTNGIFAVRPYSHADFGKNLEVRIDANTSVVHGFIADNLGAIVGSNVRYEVDIYLYENQVAITNDSIQLK